MASGIFGSNKVYTVIILAALGFSACTDSGSDGIKNISSGKTFDNNALRVCIRFDLADTGKPYVEYWKTGEENTVFSTPASLQQNQYRSVLTNLTFNATYQYRIVVLSSGKKIRSGVHAFSTGDVPDQYAGLYHVAAEAGTTPPAGLAVPAIFRKGSMLVYNRLTPGFIGMIDYAGQLRWCQTIRNSGVKVAHFTKRRTILSILAPMDYPTSYGNEILELSLAGDTVFHIKKGEKDFRQTIHHEILLNAGNQYVTLYADERVFNLSGAGGGKADTVKGDGIMVLDGLGKKVWSWSVFDALDPVREKGIVKVAKDWMHANSLFIDADGNYLISFYNNGQIWKIDASTKKVIWKLGRGGDFSLPSGVSFDQGHAVHMNDRNQLMLFDNGTSKGRSQILAFDLHESTKQALPELCVPLQQGVFTDRMGSAYLVNDTTILTCISKQNTVLLINKKGEVLWKMTCANTPYRVEFIPFDRSMPFIGE